MCSIVLPKWTLLMGTCNRGAFKRGGQLVHFTRTAATQAAGSSKNSSGSSDATSDKKQFLAALEKYSTYQPTPVSIQHFIEFGFNATAESSFLFLKRELPVRLANIMKELQLLPQQLHQTHACRVVVDEYAQSFRDVLSFETADSTDSKVLDDFSSVLYKIRERHSNTVICMAEAVMELKNVAGHDHSGKQPRYMENIQYFLDRLYTSRISTRMLINQHTSLFADPTTVKDGRRVDKFGRVMVGNIDPHCEIAPIVEKAYESARDICEYHYMTAPELDFRAVNGVPGDNTSPEEISFVYVPSHLYHILFELIKNSMRATIERHGDHTVYLPPVKVRAIKGVEDVTIRVSDQGGGIPRRLKDQLFEYLYTTAQTPALTTSTEAPGGSIGMAGPAPLAGHGYGLPLSRLYARYFAGDLDLSSIEGYGTEVFVYLQALESEAKERLPVYHETGSKKIYEAKLTASDWTGSNSDR